MTTQVRCHPSGLLGVVPGCWFRPGLVLAIVAMWGLNQGIQGLSLLFQSLCVYFPFSMYNLDLKKTHILKTQIFEFNILWGCSKARLKLISNIEFTFVASHLLLFQMKWIGCPLLRSYCVSPEKNTPSPAGIRASLFLSSLELRRQEVSAQISLPPSTMM